MLRENNPKIYFGIFKYFEKYAIELGGTSGSLATQAERTVLNDQIYDVMKGITDNYSPEISKEQLLNIYQTYFNERKESLLKALDALQPKEEVVAEEVK